MAINEASIGDEGRYWPTELEVGSWSGLSKSSAVRSTFRARRTCSPAAPRPPIIRKFEPPVPVHVPARRAVACCPRRTGLTRYERGPLDGDGDILDDKPLFLYRSRGSSRRRISRTACGGDTRKTTGPAVDQSGECWSASEMQRTTRWPGLQSPGSPNAQPQGKGVSRTPSATRRTGSRRPGTNLPGTPFLPARRLGLLL